MSGIRLLPAGPAHAAVLAALHAAAAAHGDTPWTPPGMGRILAIPGTCALLAVAAGDSPDNGNPVGFVMVRVAADESEILMLGVVPAWRRQGVARSLLDGAARVAARGGAVQLILEVAADNAAARALYETTGFTSAGRRRAYYRRPDGEAMDALILARSLVSPPCG